MASHLKVCTGTYFVNHSRKIIREVVLVKGQTVVFITHHLDTGNSDGSTSECKILDFLQWAHHEASTVEMSSLLNRKRELLLRAEQFVPWETVEPESQLTQL